MLGSVRTPLATDRVVCTTVSVAVFSVTVMAFPFAAEKTSGVSSFVVWAPGTPLTTTPGTKTVSVAVSEVALNAAVPPCADASKPVAPLAPTVWSQARKLRSPAEPA